MHVPGRSADGVLVGPRARAKIDGTEPARTKKSLSGRTVSQSEATSLEELIARCALGERAAFSRLYRATSAKLFGVLLRILKQRVWAEEALQETYLKVWRHAGSYSAARGAPMTWLINIARHQAFDLHRRTEYRVGENLQGFEETLVDAADPEADAETRRALARLQRCLERLSADQRQSLLLAYHEGLGPTELAAHVQRPLATVKTWLRRGLLQLRECMKP
jgi:RNA polymerase sigma-70 factor (ECF subfamily)